MKKRYLFLLILLGLTAALLSIGCTKTGTLIITNDTNGDLWISFDDTTIESSDTSVDSGDGHTEEYELSYTLLDAESLDVDFTVSGDYKRYETMKKTVTAGEDTPVSISSDRGGILIVDSYYSYAISQIYLVPSPNGYNNNWGSDYLSGYLYYGDTYYFKVTAGSWDLLVFDTSTYGRYRLNIDVTADAHRTLTYYGSSTSWGYTGVSSGSDEGQINLDSTQIFSSGAEPLNNLEVVPQELSPAVK